MRPLLNVLLICTLLLTPVSSPASDCVPILYRILAKLGYPTGPEALAKILSRKLSKKQFEKALKELYAFAESEKGIQVQGLKNSHEFFDKNNNTLNYEQLIQALERTPKGPTQHLYEFSFKPGAAKKTFKLPEGLSNVPHTNTEYNPAKARGIFVYVGNTEGERTLRFFDKESLSTRRKYHSSLVKQGETVFFAGAWGSDKGKLIYMDNLTGHFGKMAEGYSAAPPMNFVNMLKEIIENQEVGVSNLKATLLPNEYPFSVKDLPAK